MVPSAYLDARWAVVQLCGLQPGSHSVLLVPAAGAAAGLPVGAGLGVWEVVHCPGATPDFAVRVVEGAKAMPDLIKGQLQAKVDE